MKELPHIVQHPRAYSQCTGCHSCELVCSLTREGVTGPDYSRIMCKLGDIKSMVHTVLTCQQCIDHPCYEACPKKNQAMCIDENGIVYINEEFCIGCGLCQRACKFTPSRINLVKTKDRNLRKAKKCDLCRGRTQGPACVQHCPTLCLGISTEPAPFEFDEKGVCIVK